MSRVISLIKIYGEVINKKRYINFDRVNCRNSKRMDKLGQISKNWLALTLESENKN